MWSTSGTAACCSSVRMPSVAPKSTVLSVIALMPPPLPMA
jgi:hypothetical protein